MLNSAVVRFNDPYQYETGIRSDKVNVLITSAGLFRAELTRIDLPRLWMQRGRETLPRVTRVAVSKGRSSLLFLAHDCQPSMLCDRTELSPDEIMLYSFGGEQYQRTQGPIEWDSMSLSPEDLSEAGRALAGRELTPPSADRAIRPSPELMARLRRLHQTADHMAATVPDILAHPEVARAVEQELVHTMVRAIVEGTGTEPEPAPRHRVPVMRRLEKVLEANPDTPLYLPEICAAVGVSARTLWYHCMEHLGMSPHRYLWLRRMNLAHRALLRADFETCSVTGISNDHGFAELGRFSVAYRKLFGESPSVTLRRPAEDSRRITPDDFFHLPILT